VLAQLPSRQAMFAAIGFGLMFLVAVVDYHYWLDLGRLFYVAVVGLLISLNIVGTALFGSARWVKVGPLFLQPSEFAKLVLILVQARFLAARQEEVGQLRTILLSGALTAGLAVWVFLQPDLSTSITLVVIWLAMLWAAGLRWRHMLGFGFLGLMVALIGFPFLQPYQQQRVIQFS